MAEMPWWYTPLPPPRTVAFDERDWCRRPKTYRHRPGTWFFVGQLAEALGRSAATIRRWERLGWIPRSPHFQHGITTVDGVENICGRRRLYTEAMIEVAVRIAAEEGLLDTLRCCPADTFFCERVAEAWAELELLPPPVPPPEPPRIRPWDETKNQPPPRQPGFRPPG